MLSINDVIEVASASIKDERVIGGEAAVLTVKPNVESKEAMQIVIADVIRFMGKSTGRMYTEHRESYSNTYRIQEAGHLAYGLKVTEQSGKIIIQPIAVLEDTDILRRYVRRIRNLAQEEK
jgi:hypothetical protein